MSSVQAVPSCPVRESEPASSSVPSSSVGQAMTIGELRAQLYAIDESVRSRSNDAPQLKKWGNVRDKVNEDLCQVNADLQSGKLNGNEATKAVESAQSALELFRTTLGTGAQPAESQVEKLLGNIAENAKETATDARALSGWQGLRIVSQLLPQLADSGIVPADRKEGLRALPGLIERARNASTPDEIRALAGDWMKLFPSVQLPDLPRQGDRIEPVGEKASPDVLSPFQQCIHDRRERSEGIMPCNRLLDFKQYHN